MNQGQQEYNAIARQAERVGSISLTTNVNTTPVINKANFAGLSGVKVSGSATDFTFHVANGDSPYQVLDAEMIGDENAFVAPDAIWAFEKVKIVANAAGVYELRLVG
jgi:hypothetical protein